MQLLEAIKFYESAIHLEPGFLRAARALAGHLLRIEGIMANGVLILLGRYLRQWAINSADGAVDVVSVYVFSMPFVVKSWNSFYKVC
jgi:hypothetical protein